jgi:hypothetical protein
MKIPVFISRPTSLNAEQETAKNLIYKMLDDFKLEPRSLGTTEYPKDYPLKEVLLIAKHCHGGIILGFEQFSTTSGTWKKGTPKQQELNKPASFPTPWNQLEAGIIFGLKLPLIIFKEDAIEGGVFDKGVTDVFIQTMPMGKITKDTKDALKDCIMKWHTEVQTHYNNF